MLKKTVIIAIVMVAMILILLLPLGMSVIVKDCDGKVYFEKSVGHSDIVSLGFTHSVEKVPIVDTFIVSADGTLLLFNTTFDSSGAGIPSEWFYNITTDSNGNFTITNINQTFTCVNFVTGSTPKHYLVVSGDDYPIYLLVPEGKPLILLIEHNTPASLLLNRIRTYI